MLNNFHTILIANLRGDVPEDDKAYLTPQEAQDILQVVTEENFGTDADAWECFFEETSYEVAFKGFSKWVRDGQKPAFME